jgi:hypothetical protein
MAGLGRKVWAAGDVLAAADVNGYLMDQAVMVFDDATARTAAIGTPTEGMMSYTKDDNAVQVYNGTAWAAVDTTTSSLNGTAIVYTVTASTATAYTLAATDNGKILQFTGGTTVITIGTATAMSSGGRVEILNDASAMTISAGTGVTLGGAGTAGTGVSFSVGSQYDGLGIIALGSNAYRVIGNISVV